MTSIRRRSQKATFNLSPSVLAELERAVTAGAAPSKNAFVERALEAALEEHRREERRHAWAEARQDPLFLRDLEEVQAAFRTADAESAWSIG
jgi:Arc/MetJ-type ribon-helix-helix transcriptional regulator